MSELPADEPRLFDVPCASCGGTKKDHLGRPCMACQPAAPSVGIRKAARPTEVKAAWSHYPKSGTVRLAVLRAYADVFPNGMTHEELSYRMGNPATSTFRARASELEKGGWLRDSGKTRKTGQGEDSVVWVLTDHAAKREGVFHRITEGRKPYGE